MMAASRNTITGKPNLSEILSLVTKMAKKRKPGIFDNKYPEIDSEILKYFFKITRNSKEPEIKIFADDLSKITSKKGKFLDELFDYIDKSENSKIFLVLKKTITLEPKFNAGKLLLSFSLNEKYKERVKLRYLKPDIDISDLFEESPAFFAVTSNNIFRLEKSNGSAKFSFNNKDVSAKLNNIFNDLFSDKYTTLPIQSLSESKPSPAVLTSKLENTTPKKVRKPLFTFSILHQRKVEL